MKSAALGRALPQWKSLTFRLTGSGYSWVNVSCSCLSKSSRGSWKRRFGKSRTSSFQVHTTYIGQTLILIWQLNLSNILSSTL